MNATIRIAAPLVAALAMAACSGNSSNVPNPSAGSAVANVGQPVQAHLGHALPTWLAKGQARAVCPQVIGRPTCLALTTKGVSPACTGASCGLTPTDLQTRYKITSKLNRGAGQIVAIVDAGDNPDVATDLSTYRSQFGLGTANFAKYNQNGQQSNYPTYTGWSVEIDLDVDMVSAVCPKCTIYLVEANSSSTSDLETAEKEAVTLGAHIISNSWICYGSVNCDDPSAFDTPGVMYLAASGDFGYNDNGAPEALASVVSVGGTQLTKSGSTYSETVWDGAGSGCATGITKPAWQHDTGCTSRTDTDISSEAGCSPGVAEYDQFDGGWFGECGTSAASPTIAGLYGLKGNASTQNAGERIWSQRAHRHNRDLHDITSGSNGSCGGSYLCTGVAGYDGPSGWGTPNGLGAL